MNKDERLKKIKEKWSTYRNLLSIKIRDIRISKIMKILNRI